MAGSQPSLRPEESARLIRQRAMPRTAYSERPKSIGVRAKAVAANASRRLPRSIRRRNQAHLSAAMSAPGMGAAYARVPSDKCLVYGVRADAATTYIYLRQLE